MTASTHAPAAKQGTPKPHGLFLLQGVLPIRAAQVPADILARSRSLR